MEILLLTFLSLLIYGIAATLPRFAAFGIERVSGFFESRFGMIEATFLCFGSGVQYLTHLFLPQLSSTPYLLSFLPCLSPRQELDVLRDILPYSIAHQDVDVDVDGAAIYSKFPLENTSVKSLGGGRKSVLADIKIQGKVISIIAVHPSNAIGKAYVEERNRQLEAIANYVAQVEQPLLVGDFNVTMWSPYYRRMVSKAKLHNARSGFGILPTWPTFRPLLFIPIDHCFVNQDTKVVNIRAGSDVGSDHLPLITDLWISRKST